MTRSRISVAMTLPILSLALLLAGCPKRPGSGAGVSAPAPGAPTPVATAPGTGMRPAASGPGDRSVAPGAQPGAGASAFRPDQFSESASVRDVHFDFDRYDIRSDDARLLDANAVYLKTNPRHLLLIEGHCDERGTTEYNLALGDRRAKAAMNYLVSQGIKSERIQIVSYGEERPACREHTEACWATNRRAHFLVKAQ
jgi:peptidoglycan-associated lipoprotein